MNNYNTIQMKIPAARFFSSTGHIRSFLVSTFSHYEQYIDFSGLEVRGSHL